MSKPSHSTIMKAFGLGNPSLTKKLSSTSGVDEPSSAYIMAVKVFVASIIKSNNYYTVCQTYCRTSKDKFGTSYHTAFSTIIISTRLSERASLYDVIRI